MATDAQRRKLKEAVKNGGRLRAHGVLRERRRRPKPLERYELGRYGGVAGVFVTERGRAEAALARETVQERIERRHREGAAQ